MPKTEDERIVTVKGRQYTLVGDSVKVGASAPDFIVVDRDFSPMAFSSFLGKPCILSSVLSLDTEVCDAQTRRFNEEAARLDSDIKVLTLSMDLPFAMARWCGATSAPHVILLSDHRDASFGTGYGMLIKDLRLLARGVFVVDREGILRHKEIVREVENQPDYEAAIEQVRKWS